MADILTQLQDALDQLTQQMYLSLNYINTRAPYRSVGDQPDADPLKPENLKAYADAEAQTQVQNHPNTPADPAPPVAVLSQNIINRIQENPWASDYPVGPRGFPHPPEVFHDALKELARDLVATEQEIEFLIGKLPGIGKSEKEQKEKLRELEEQLKTVEEQRVEALKEKESLVQRLDNVLQNTRRW